MLSILLSLCHLASIPLIVGFIDQQGRISTNRTFLLNDYKIKKYVDKIVVQLNQESEDILSNNGFLLSLEEHKDKIKVFKASDGNLKGLKNHFMITKTDKGNYALRFETNITEHIATGTFNGGSNGEKLFDFFQKNINNNNVVLINNSIWPQA